MYPRYEDIREKLGEPLWHDYEGVPRYKEYHPRLLGVYDSISCLFVVECQACAQKFDCARGICPAFEVMRGFLPTEDFNTIFEEKKALEYLLSWGDAPFHGGCMGETMSTSIVAVKQFWKREGIGDWEKVDLSNDLVQEVLELWV